jgi:hypothetical protein
MIFLIAVFLYTQRRRRQSFFRNKNGCSFKFYIISRNVALFRGCFWGKIFSSKVPKLKKPLFQNVPYLIFEGGCTEDLSIRKIIGSFTHWLLISDIKCDILPKNGGGDKYLKTAKLTTWTFFYFGLLLPSFWLCFFNRNFKFFWT